MYLGEKYLGKAPLKDRKVPVGRHSLTLVDQAGHRSQQWVNVREGRTAEFVVVMGQNR